MNCRDFETRWNELLDARPAGPSQLESELEAHALACEPCRGISARYQVLRVAISAWPAPPAPSARSIERLHALTVPATPGRKRQESSPWRTLVPLATAAALLALVWQNWPVSVSTPSSERVPSLAAPVAANRPLGTALAEATEATIDLALEASGPAARIGRELLDLDHLETPVVLKKVVEPSAPEDDSPTNGLFQSVGERVNAGVKPISGSARHAFGFLIGAPTTQEPTPAESRGSL